MGDDCMLFSWSSTTKAFVLSFWSFVHSLLMSESEQEFIFGDEVEEKEEITEEESSMSEQQQVSWLVAERLATDQLTCECSE